MKCFTCFAYLTFEDEVEVNEDDNVEVSSLRFAPDCCCGGTSWSGSGGTMAGCMGGSGSGAIMTGIG